VFCWLAALKVENYPFKSILNYFPAFSFVIFGTSKTCSRMLRIISANRFLLLAYLLVLSAWAVILFHFGKKDAHLILTSYHTGSLDILMRVLTFAGDGLFMVIVAIILLFAEIRKGLEILASFIATSLLIQILKRLVFPHQKRPVAWFHEIGIELSKVPGVEYHSSFSFPSGHTATAFALFFGLAFMVQNKFLRTVCFLGAVLTGFTRVYLSQHFIGDAMAGSVIGVCSAILFCRIFSITARPWMDKPASTLIFRGK
jgi:membrane-associated phospholipid phosphatase